MGSQCSAFLFIVSTPRYSTGSLFSCVGYGQKRSYTANNYINKLNKKVQTEFDLLPDNSVIKRSESWVSSRVVLSCSDVIETLYGLVANKEIKDYHHTPESLHVPGIYCFLSKDGLSFYIGSSLNMHTRYTRHLSNLNQHSNKRNYEASPKFYNYIRKHGLDNLSTPASPGRVFVGN